MQARILKPYHTTYRDVIDKNGDFVGRGLIRGI